MHFSGHGKTGFDTIRQALARARSIDRILRIKTIMVKKNCYSIG